MQGVSAIKKPTILLITLYGVENVGVRSISAVLKEKGFSVHLLFFKKWVNNDLYPPTIKEKELLKELLNRLQPDLVGVSFGLPYFELATEVTEIVHAQRNVPVVWGGIHPTLAPDECIDIADIVCRGEGEYAMVELMECLQEGKPFDAIKNVWVRSKGGVVRNEVRPLIDDLDVLPVWDMQDEGKYYLEDNQLKTGEPLSLAAEMRVFASRGCPYSCSYCYNSTLRKLYAHKGAYHRPRSVQSMIAELKLVKQRFRKARLIKFDDDTFDFNKEWVKDFARAYQQHIGIPFTIMLRPETVDMTLLVTLKAAGLRKVQIGVQTNSEGHLKDMYERSAALEDIVAFSEMNQRLKLDVTYDVILDDPLATDEDKVNLLNFFLKIKRPFNLFLYSLTVFPHTRLAQILIDKGVMTAEEIQQHALKALRQYRLSFHYPRPAKDIFFISLLSLTSKSFVPRSVIRWLSRIAFLKIHPLPIRMMAEMCNFIKISSMAVGMLMRGELSAFKIKEYGSAKRIIIQ